MDLSIWFLNGSFIIGFLELIVMEIPREEFGRNPIHSGGPYYRKSALGIFASIGAPVIAGTVSSGTDVFEQGSIFSSYTDSVNLLDEAAVGVLLVGDGIKRTVERFIDETSWKQEEGFRRRGLGEGILQREGMHLVNDSLQAGIFYVGSFAAMYIPAQIIHDYVLPLVDKLF